MFRSGAGTVAGRTPRDPGRGGRATRNKQKNEGRKASVSEGLANALATVSWDLYLHTGIYLVLSNAKLLPGYLVGGTYYCCGRQEGREGRRGASMEASSKRDPINNFTPCQMLMASEHTARTRTPYVRIVSIRTAPMSCTWYVRRRVWSFISRTCYKVYLSIVVAEVRT